MKKTFVIVTGLLIMAAGAYVAFAQRTPGPPVRQDPAGIRKSARPVRWKGGDMCPMHCGIMRAMTDKEMEVTDNGEVIVMVGCQLFKYDANLNLVAQTQIEIDMEAVQKKMQQMMENCPMRRQMMQQDDDNSDDNGNQN